MGDPYYEDEYEDEDDYEDYCHRCGLHWNDCWCNWQGLYADPDAPESAQAEEFCECGALIDAQGFCPYCDYLPEDDPHEVGEFWDWFSLLDIDDELREE